MKTIIEYKNQNYQINLQQPINISMPLDANKNRASAWYCPPTSIEPVMTEHFVGDVNRGGAVNFRNISFNPHGNGTHTECVGHISKEPYSIRDSLKTYFFFAQLVTVTATKLENGDHVILPSDLPVFSNKIDALIIRTVPNNDNKLTRQYSNTNPPYFAPETIQKIVAHNIQHLLVDLPSIDREQDEGKLAGHHIFWDYPNNPRLEATITELIYVPNRIKDDFYFLNLQLAPFVNDASPSQPILYQILS